MDSLTVSRLAAFLPLFVACQPATTIGGDTTCGDGVRDPTEMCDGNDLGAATCASIGNGGGALACRRDCTLDVTGCVAAGVVCGDDVVAGLEQCDGADLRGHSCQSLSLGAGDLACTVDCSFDVTGCASQTATYDLSGAAGCEGVYNPDQVLDYALTMSPAEWSAVLAEPGDGSSTLIVVAQLSCGGGPSIPVGVHRKRSGGTHKIGLKIDVNYAVDGLTSYGLKNLIFDNSVASGDASDGSLDLLVREYLGWRMLGLAGAVASRAVFANLSVNNAGLGVFLNVEAVDKVFLHDRFADASGWLHKLSGGPGDGLKTHESDGLADQNPYEDYFCFWTKGQACPVPTDVGTTLPEHLQLDQLLRVGAVNALIANTDGLIFKDNNYYHYDYAGGRVYLPWDLDTAMNAGFDPFTGAGVGGRTTMYTDVLFPTFEADYDELLTTLMAVPLTRAAIDTELARVVTVASVAMAADPYVGGDAATPVAAISSWWDEQYPAVAASVAAH
ncbi:MAG: CotH kinase family protein [Deltaproteobacteria bacterium]|nr:CotH kinase family protein [Deltaproteobacteria bacterium]